MTSENKKSHGLTSVIFALLGNIIIAVLKGIGFFLSGSGALFSETIHSIADTLNESFLLIGVKRSSKKADQEFSYGYGKERFVRALISACGIFFIGAGITVYHGILSLLSHHEILTNRITFSILGVSFILEGTTFSIALKELIHANPQKKLKHIFADADPVTLAVVYEDGVALLGVIVAGVSIWLTHITGQQIRDSIGSISIGVMLGILAILLINKNRHFLVGKTIPKKMKKEIIELMEQEEIIQKVMNFKSNILDIGKYHIKCEIECNGTALLKTIGKHEFLKKEYEKVKEKYENFLEFCVDYTRRVPKIIGEHIDNIERKIKERFPQIKYIDIEIN